MALFGVKDVGLLAHFHPSLFKQNLNIVQSLSLKKVKYIKTVTTIVCWLIYLFFDWLVGQLVAQVLCRSGKNTLIQDFFLLSLR